MIRPILTLLIVTVIATTSYAQSNGNETDSIQSLLANTEETERISLLLTLCDSNLSSPESQKYALEALQLAERINNTELTIKALDLLGQFHNWHYNEHEALEYFYRALKLSKESKKKEQEVESLRHIGTTYFYLDSLDLAISYAKEALNLAQEHNYKDLEGRSLSALGRYHSTIGHIDTAIVLLRRAVLIQRELGEQLNEANAFKDLGDIYYDTGNYSEAIESYNNGIRILEEIDDDNELARASQRLGNTHMSLGNYQLALEQYQLSLSLWEKTGDKLNIALLNYNIGQVFENLSRNALAIEENEENYRKALEFHEQALRIFEEKDEIRLVGSTLNSIANIYDRLAENEFISQYGEYWEDSLQDLSSNIIRASFGRAVEYYKQSLSIFEDLEDYEQIAGVNLNLGRIHTLTREWSQAEEHLSTGKEIASAYSLPNQETLAYFYIGFKYFRQRNLPVAIEYLKQSATKSAELGIKEIERWSYNILSRIYERQGNYSTALNYHRQSVLVKDEIFNEQSQKIISELQTKYETEKKEQEIVLLNNQRALQESVIQRQKLMIVVTIIGLVMILGFALLLLRLFQNKRKANRILEEKNNLISLQKQEITDSIRYASRIQGAVLPSQNLLNELLNDHFVLFLPRDIVSGDFYWVTKQGGKIILVAADCTGHGVPGAFMSMLGVSFLYEIVNKEGIMQPAEILNRLRELIKHTLSQTGKTHEQKDGMDISLGVLDTNNLHLEWAGAYNPLYIIRNGELIEHKANKMPIAIHIIDHLPFTNHDIELEPGDTFYMFSDGFPDQFGGENGRKFMTKRFKQLLVDINPLPMDEQKEILHQKHLEWKGDFEQIDDIIILGVKV